MSILKRVISLLLCVIMMVSVLSSCGEVNSHDNGTNKPTTEHSQEREPDESVTEKSQEGETDHTHTDTKPSEETTDGNQSHKHTLATSVTENVVEATCTQTGSYDEVVYCSECQEEISRTKKTVDKKPHEYSQKVTTPQYLKTEATCTDSAVYYYSCVCGEAGTATFLYGEVLNIPVESISLNKSDVYLEVGDSTVLSVMFTPADVSDRNITWVSSNSNIVLVNNGVIVGVNPGVTTVIAMCSNGKTASCRVEVGEKTYYAESVTLSDSTLEIRVGEQYTLAATIMPNYTTDKTLVWSSSAPNVVSVEDGKLTALAQGSATITVTTANGISASCIVMAEYIPVEEIIVENSFMYIDAGESASVGITILPNNATFLFVDYTSSNESVATVSNGVITAISDGVAVITVSIDGIVSKSFTVCVENGEGIEYQENGSGYKILSIPNPQETVVIPETYKGKTINAIASNAFGTASSVIKNLYISKSTTIPDASLTNCTQLEKLVLYGGGWIFPSSSDPYDFYRYFEGTYITLELAPGALIPACGSYSHVNCEGTCSWEVANPNWTGWVHPENGGSVDWYYPFDMDNGAYFRRDDVIDLQNYNGYKVPKLISVRVYKVPKSLIQFNDGYSDILSPESSTVCITAVDDLKIKFDGELLDIPLVSVVSHEDREKLHTIGTHSVTVYYRGLSETVSITVGHIINSAEENRVEATCTADGHYDSVTYCGKCNDELSRETITLEKLGHSPKSASEENCVDATCTEDGHYDSVVYCDRCDGELSRETKIITAGHKPSDAIIENQVGTACHEGGNYDLVIYCSVCNDEISRTNEIIEKIGIHTIADGVCMYCGLPQSSEGLEYSLNEDGKTYTVMGKGTFSGTNLVIGIYNNCYVTNIGEYAFRYCDFMSMELGNTVTSIGHQAFAYCNNLTSVTIPDSVTNIDYGAFENCDNLIAVTIGSSVTNISSYAFYNEKLIEVYNRSSLSIVAGSNSFGKVGYYAKNIYTSSSGASKLSTNEDGYIFYIDGGTRYLMGKIDARTATTLALPVDCKGMSYELYTEAFYGCENITSVIIPNSVTGIGDRAFFYCQKLDNLVIGDSVISIGRQAFSYCNSLEIITIPDSVINIASSAFYSSNNLKNIIVAQNNVAYQSIDGNLYSRDGKVLIQYAAGKTVTSFTIPNSVINISEYAFAFCKYLKRITIDNSVTSIGKGAFANCSNLTSITIPDSVANIAEETFKYCERLTTVMIGNSVTKIGEDAFWGCKSLTNITIPNSVISIDEYAFYNCVSLTSVIVPNSVTSIGKSAFYNCTSLTSIIIPNSITSIGSYAFGTCVSLAKIKYSGTESEWQAITKGNSWDSNTGDYTITYNYKDE